MDKLTTEQLQIKINTLNNTVVALKLALFEVRCDNAKKIIQYQINIYNNMLRNMMSLLIDRGVRG